MLDGGEIDRCYASIIEDRLVDAVALVPSVVNNQTQRGVGPRSWAQADVAAGWRTKDSGESQKQSGENEKESHCLMM